MRFKSFVSMGVAAVLIVPTLITAANPELAYAKTTSKTSKKISAKAKSVIAKIKAINPKKSNYVTKTKSAVNAYKKLSIKDKKMVYNYGTLKKHWTIVQNKKANQVIASIKTINPKKADYVLKTKSALSAYNKLSKTDKKKVTNYSTLKKHWKNIQPYLKKVDAFNKSVAALNKTNFATKSVALEKQYDNLDSITKAAIPSATLDKLNNFGDVVKAKTLIFNTLSLNDSNDSNNTNDTDPNNQNNTDSNNNTGTSTAKTTEDGTKILNVINAYKKLSGAQQTLLKDLLTANSSANSPEEQKEEEKKEKARKNLDRYLAVEDLVKKAADIEKKYLALQPVKKAKPKDLVALYDGYYDVQNESIDYKEKDSSGNEIEPDKPKTYKVSDFVPHSENINNIGVAYENEVNNAKDFKDLIDKLENDTDPDPYKTIQEINKTTSVYKTPSISIKENPLGYPLVAPIDLADKNAVTTYKKYEPVPGVVVDFETIKNIKPLSEITWIGSGNSDPSKSLLSSTEITKLPELLTKYNKLGAKQKEIVKGQLGDNVKGYLSESKNLTSAQAIDKSYASAIKNKAKSSYFADLKKVYDAYSTATPEVKRFVVNADKINGIPSDPEYKDAKNKVDEFTTAVNSIPNAKDAETAYIEIVGGKKDDTKIVDGVIPQYKTISSKPAWLALVDKNTLKTYGEYAKVPDVLKLKLPTSTPYKSKDITNILNAIKEYKKLGKPQKEIVDSKNSAFSSFADDESKIKEAQKIDTAYLKLKKSSKTYPKDAKKVYEAYTDALDDVKNYLVNKDKINALESTYSDENKLATKFEEMVNKLSKNSSIKDVNDTVDYYNGNIFTSPKTSSLIDKSIMKKYNEYAQVSNVDKLLNLIIGVDTNSKYITPTNVQYIQKATIAYNALKPDPKMIIDAADRKKFPFLYETKNILDAVAIDKAYEKIKPTDDKYELDLIDLYREMYVSAPFAQKYVTHKDEFDRIESLYKEPIAKAEEFETSVDKMSQVSQSNGTPTMEMVRNLEAQYYDLVNYNKFGTKYKFPLKDMIRDDKLAEYNKFVLVLRIQDIAKTLYVSYGKLFNEENVDFDYVKDDFYCKKAEDSSDQNIKNEYKDNCKRRDDYLADSTETKTKYKVGYTVSNSRYGQPMKISNPNDIKLIYKAIDYFQQLDSTQLSILKKAPSSQKDYYYEDRYKGKHKDGKYEEKEIVHPSIPMSDGEIKNFLKAQEIDKEYEALNPSSKTYIKDAIVLYYKFDKAGKPVQLYVVHEDDIKALKNSYNMDKLIKEVDTFVNTVNLLPNDNLIDNQIKNGKNGVVDQYNKLNEAQQAVLDKGVLTKYNTYAPIADIMTLTGEIDSDKDGKYIDSDIDKMLKAIATYKKLSKDPKAMVTKKINGTDKDAPSYQYLNHETEIKAAQKVDNAFKKLDKTDDKYVTSLKKVAKDYDALTTTSKDYVTSNINEALKVAVYSTPKGQAEAFEKLIVGDKANENDEAAWLNMEKVPYENIANAVIEYNKLSTKAKSLVDDDVMKIYNKYAPVVTIVQTLGRIPIPDYNNLDDTENNNIPDITGYYKNKGIDAGTEILNAIQLYQKLGSDQKDIVMDDNAEPYYFNNEKEYPLTKTQLNLLQETNNIKAAQALDKKIAAIKPNSTSYVKGVIDAKKTLEVMPKEQRVYLLNAKTLTDYEANSQTKKAINDLKDFELGVKQVDQWTSEMEKNSNGEITGTCTDNSKDSKDPASTIPCSSAIITKQMNDLKNLFTQLNTPRLVDESEIKLASLIDRTILARYQYFRAIYDVIDDLKK